MKVNLIDFKWPKCLDGYRVSGGHIESKSRWIAWDRPLDHHPALFRDFASVPPTPEGLCAFCDRVGPLLGGLPEHAHQVIEAAKPASIEPLAFLLADHARMVRAVRLFEIGDTSELEKQLKNCGKAYPALRKDADGKPRVVLVPEDLLSAMWLQFAFYVASEAKLQRCEHCGKGFQTGTGTGRRSTAKYCSNACKQAAHKVRHPGDAHA